MIKNKAHIVKPTSHTHTIGDICELSCNSIIDVVICSVFGGMIAVVPLINVELSSVGINFGTVTILLKYSTAVKMLKLRLNGNRYKELS